MEVLIDEYYKYKQNNDIHIIKTIVVSPPPKMNNSSN